MEILGTIIVVLLGLFIIALPVKMAAATMGAERTGVFWCLIALIGSSILHSIGLVVPCLGSVIAFLLSSLAFAAILGTGFLRGIGIHILAIVFSALLVGCLSIVLGINLADLLEMISEVGLPVNF
jgi:hypothetical protein